MNENNNLNNGMTNQNKLNGNEPISPVTEVPTENLNPLVSPAYESVEQNPVETPQTINTEPVGFSNPNIEPTYVNLNTNTMNSESPIPTNINTEGMNVESPIPTNNNTENMNGMANQNVEINNNLVQPTANTSTEINKPYKRSKKWLFIILASLFILLVVGGLLVFFSIKKNTNTAFLLSLNNLKTEMSQIVKPIAFLPDDYSENYSIDGNIDVNIAYDKYNDEIAMSEMEDTIINLINKINFKYTTKVDIKNKKLLYQFNPTIDDKELFNIKLINNDKNNYLFLGNIYDKYIQLEDVDFQATDIIDSSVRTEEINEIYDVILLSLKENLKEEYFVREDATIKMGNDTKEVLKSTLILNQKNTTELFLNVVKSLKENEKTKSIITKYDPEFFNDFEEEIKLSENTEDSSVLYFSTYMNKITGKHYQYEIKTTSEYEDFSAIYILSDIKEIDITYDNKYIEENSKSYKIFIDTTDEETSIEVKDINNNTIITSTLTKEKITYNQSYEVDNQVVEIKFTYEIKQVEGKDEYKIVISGLLEGNKDNQKLVTINVNSDNLLKKNISINENVTDIIKSSEMTEEDFNEIINRLFSIYLETIE
ncbi:MAG: hypothetical protein ACM3O4_02980 [Ignavibacteriales bacterium]